MSQPPHNLPRTGAWAAVVALAALVAFAVLVPAVMAVCFDERFDAQHLGLGAVPPSWRHPFGTDAFGRDLLVRTACGLRISLWIGGMAALVAAVLGTWVGAVAGYAGGWLDAWLMRGVDVLFALPFVFIVILLVTIFGRSLPLLFVALGAVGWLGVARGVRAQVMLLRRQPFVDALTLLGASHARILLVHLVPNTLGVVLALFALSMPTMVLEEAFLSFLGLGVQPPNPSLGTLIQEGATQVRLFWWPLAFPGVCIVALLATLQSVGDAVRRWFS